MTAREWLSQIRRTEFEIQQRKAQIESMYNSIKAVSYGNVPGAHDNDATLHLVERIMKLQDLQRLQIEELEETRQEIIDEIRSIQNVNVAQVLYYKYCECLTFKEIARKMSYSGARIYQLHNEGLALIGEH